MYLITLWGDVAAGQGVEGGGEGGQDHAHPPQRVRPAVAAPRRVLDRLKKDKEKHK